MGDMKDLSIEADEICLMCDSENCASCQMVIKKDGVKYTISGNDRSILKTEVLDIGKETANG